MNIFEILKILSLLYVATGSFIVFKTLWFGLTLNSDISIRFRQVLKKHPFVTTGIMLLSIFWWPLLLFKY